MVKKSGEAEAPTEVVSKETAPIVEEPAQIEPLDAEALKTEFEAYKEATQKEIEKWQTEAKAHQKTASKKAQDAQDFKSFQESVTARIDTLAEIVEESFTKRQEEEDESPKERKTNYREKVKQHDESLKTNVNQTMQQQVQSKASEIVRLTNPLKLELDQSPELQGAYVKWLEGLSSQDLSKIDESVEEVRKVVSKMSEAMETSKDSKVENETAMRERIEKEVMEKHGLLNTETGQPSGTSQTLIEKEQAFIRGEITSEDLPPELKRKYT